MTATSTLIENLEDLIASLQTNIKLRDNRLRAQVAQIKRLTSIAYDKQQTIEKQAQALYELRGAQGSLLATIDDLRRSLDQALARENKAKIELTVLRSTPTAYVAIDQAQGYELLAKQKIKDLQEANKGLRAKNLYLIKCNDAQVVIIRTTQETLDDSSKDITRLDQERAALAAELEEVSNLVAPMTRKLSIVDHILNEALGQPASTDVSIEAKLAILLARQAAQES